MGRTETFYWTDLDEDTQRSLMTKLHEFLENDHETERGKLAANLILALGECVS